MKRRHVGYITFIALLLTGINVLAQSSINNDSLLNKKATTAFALAFRNADSAMIVANAVLKEASETDDKKAIANAYNSIGWAFMHKGHLDSSIMFLLKSRQLFYSLKSHYDVARVDINLAEVYTKQNKIAEALNYLIQADSLSIMVKSIPLQTDVKRQLAIVYRESGDNSKATGYFKEALNGFVAQEDYSRYVNTGVSLSILYRNMQQNDSSLHILDQCLAIANEKSGTPYQVAMIEENTAETYLAMEKFNDALAHYTIAYNQFIKLNNGADIAYEAFCVGKTLARLNRYKDAEDYLLKAFLLSDSLKMTNYQFDISVELASLYEHFGNWQQAYSYLQKAGGLKDSINLSEEKERTNELKEKFESEKKEQQITLLKTQNQVAELRNRRTKLFQYILILLFAASVIIGWLLLNRVKMKRKLQEEFLRNRLAGDLHDDIGSTLSSIDISSRIALVKKDDPTVVRQQLTKIQQLARKTMDSMSDIVWSINPVNDDFEKVLARMREFAAEICEPNKITPEFIVLSEIEKSSLEPDKRKNIFLIFKEAVNNAVKYSGCTLLIIAFSTSPEGGFKMKITDDGKGFDEATARKGNGLRSMKIRAEQIKGTLSIHSRERNGTVVELNCPL